MRSESRNLSVTIATPFDHLLIAQALAEPLKLVTTDKLLAKYSDIVVVV